MLQILARVLIDLYLADTVSYILLLLLIIHFGRAEEKSVWEEAVVLDTTFGWFGSYG